MQHVAPVHRPGGGRRHWHFAFAWIFVASALVYVAYLLASGEWRRRFFGYW